MHLDWFVLSPLALPVGLAAIGALGAYFVVVRRKLPIIAPGLIITLSALAIIAAITPNATQQLYDLGLRFPAIYVVQNASYLVFGASLVALWGVLRQSWTRWLLVPLIPVSFAQPALWTLAFFAWSRGGFAP